MFLKLIQALKEIKLLRLNDEAFLQSLDISTVIDLLKVNGDKPTIIAIANMLGASKFVAHDVDWQPVIQPLATLLEASDWEIRQKAAETLGRLDAHRQLAALGKLITFDENKYVRMLAIDAISAWRLLEAAPYLIPIAQNSGEALDVREVAIEALGYSPTDEAIAALVGLLKDEHTSIREVAILALHNAMAASVIPELEPLLTDETPTRHGSTIANDARQTIKYLKSL